MYALVMERMVCWRVAVWTTLTRWPGFQQVGQATWREGWAVDLDECHTFPYQIMGRIESSGETVALVYAIGVEFVGQYWLLKVS